MMDSQQGQSSSRYNRYFVRGLSWGAFAITLFGALWSGAPASTLPTAGIGILLAFVIVVIIAAALLLGSFRLLQAANAIPIDASAEGRARGNAIGKRLAIWFGVIFGSEALFIAAASSILGSTGQDAFIVPIIILIVGLHFLPLAPVFNVPLYYLTGALLILASLITLIAIPQSQTVHGVALWVVVPATCSALILWATAATILAMGRQIVTTKH